MKFLFSKLFITIFAPWLMAREEFWGAPAALSVPFSFLTLFCGHLRDVKANMQRNFLIVLVGGHLISWNIPLTKSGVLLYPLLKSGRDVSPEIS